MTTRETKLISAKDCIALARSEFYAPTVPLNSKFGYGGIESYWSTFWGMAAPDVVLLDWTIPRFTYNTTAYADLVTIPVDADGNNQNSRIVLPIGDRLRLSNFRRLAIVGVLYTRLPNSPKPNWLNKVQVGLNSVIWFDVIDRVAGGFTREFDVALHYLSRIGGLTPISYPMRGPLSVSAISELFEARQEISAVRVRPVLSQIGNDGRRKELIVTRR